MLRRTGGKRKKKKDRKGGSNLGGGTISTVRCEHWGRRKGKKWAGL